MGFLVFSRQPRSYVLGGRVGMGHCPYGRIVLMPSRTPLGRLWGDNRGASPPSTTRREIEAKARSESEKQKQRQRVKYKGEARLQKRRRIIPLSHADRSADDGKRSDALDVLRRGRKAKRERVQGEGEQKISPKP